MSYSYISSHIEDAKNRIIEQHKGKPNFENFLTIFLQRIQGLEDDLKNFVEKRSLSTATDYQLDEIAQELGIRRDGDTDARLRTRCYAQIAQYWSSGKVEQIVTILSLLTDATEVRITEIFPAKIQVEIKTDSAVDSAIEDVIRNALAAGVGLEEPIALVPNDYFGFSDDPDADGFFVSESASSGGYYSIIIQ